MTLQVIALPGGVNPAAIRYAPLASAVGDQVKLHLKDLEVYAEEEPPADYSIGLEVKALARFADSIGLERFHLLGYSGGGFVSLAFAGAYPDRLLSLALFEPAGVPGERSGEEAQFTNQLQSALAGLNEGDFMRTFIAMQVRPGVTVHPPSGPQPAWMNKRRAGLAAMMAAFPAYGFDRARYLECSFPVFIGYGDLTSEYEAVKVSVLARLLPDLRIRRFAGIHHFLPPEQIYTRQHVQSLLELWTGAEAQHHPKATIRAR